MKSSQIQWTDHTFSPVSAPVQRLMAKTWPKWWDFLNEQSNILPNPEPVRTEEG